MEERMLTALQFGIHFTSPYRFLERFMHLKNVSETEKNFALFMLEGAMIKYKMIAYKPSVLAASSLYAIAALDLGCSYINFTPSAGATPAAIGQLAIERGTCHMGYDGKTGETLLKSTLAPMFAQRHLQVMSWVGHNIFGNRDGIVLDDPTNKASKIQTKDQVVSSIVGYKPQTHVSIEYIESHSKKK